MTQANPKLVRVVNALGRIGDIELVMRFTPAIGVFSSQDPRVLIPR
jgi:hypothetical protein